MDRVSQERTMIRLAALAALMYRPSSTTALTSSSRRWSHTPSEQTTTVPPRAGESADDWDGTADTKVASTSPMVPARAPHANAVPSCAVVAAVVWRR
jgi:hypothetical protein